ncbi:MULTISPECIES: pitrilysin family protein [unclassified Sphingomonas]|jgi:zinc protease|uniref:M16 family metallopeptidase n=1 Tax=unclassified Sphingomonas TaxID=196159 RepID=UPI000E107CCE|nr:MULTISPECIES: pitrilysin family protein [unclassified Sphingomonas]AXJ95544.1 insulinase family protein [Sphingomonas sp. FARSPH]
MTMKTLWLAGAATLALVAPATAQTAKPVPAATLIKQVNIPYQAFTLKNGLRVIVSTDRKAPIVAVSVWYDVGAKHEPKGSTGFAHLFEHLMFNGSENAPGDFFEPLKQVGATDFNGTTNLDRTNYFETVPTAGLERALFLESDRMGYLLGAITQAKLDEQRGVVQNEKRQGDNQPYGLTRYKVTEGLFPATHPYGHDTIGSMADLDAASLETVKNWFRDHYGPNNAVLVLAGDIDVAQAKPLVEKYFGAIPAGPKSVRPVAPVPTLAAPKAETIKDRVAAVMVSRYWAIPGGDTPDAASLEVAGSVLGGLASSRLDTILVKQEKLAVSASAAAIPGAQVGTFAIRAIVRAGVDPALVGRRIDEILADFLATGPTADEVNRVVTTRAAGTIGGLESVGGFGGKAVALAQGALFYNDPGYYKKHLAALAAQTPASVKAAADKWLSRPAYALTVEKGPRAAYEEARVPAPAAVAAAPDTPVKGTRGPLPVVGPVTGLTFPTVQRARLSNGIEVVYAQRSAVPVTQIAVSFDAGVAADVPGKLGTQGVTLAMMDEGIEGMTSIQLAEAKERLGAQFGANGTPDRTLVQLGVPSANLAPALDLFGKVVRAPTFPEAELARVKQQTLAGIAQELTSPNGLVGRVLPPLLYGPAYPYAKAQGGGDPRAVAALTRADLIAFQRAWLRPDKAKIFVVSDRPLAEVRAALDARFGDWRPMGPAGVKDFSAPPQPSAPRIVLVDRPDSPQSVVIGAIPTALKGTQDLLPVTTANDALGGSFLSRLNMDLRETRHWSYGANGRFQTTVEAAPYVISAPVQADQTGPSLASARTDVVEFLTKQPMTQEEFDRAIKGGINALPGSYETSGAVLVAMQSNDTYRRPDDYQMTLATRLRGYTLADLNGAIRGAIDPNKAFWVVVGDAAKVKPQLDTLGLPVEVIPANAVAGAPAGGAPVAK